MPDSEGEAICKGRGGAIEGIRGVRESEGATRQRVFATRFGSYPLRDTLLTGGMAADTSRRYTVLFVLMVWYQVVPSVSVLVLPFLILLMVITATGLGMWLTALAILYRDVQYGLQFGVHLMMYLTPVVYPVSLVPEQFRLFYAINPMTGVVEGFRSALLGTNPMPWDLLAVSSVTAVLILIFGAQYFRRTELIFADVA